MGWLERLYGPLVGLDTAPLIYYMEENSMYLPLVDPFFEAIVRADIRVVTSALTLTEVLSLPTRNEDNDLIRSYSELLLDSNGLTTVPVSTDIAIEAASLRAAYGLKTPDAIQLATVKLSGASAFLTNDVDFAGVAGFQIISLDNLLI